MDAFYNFLKDVPASNIRINLQRLFKNLDIPKENRDKYDEAIRVFPYVNGGLFREDVEIPNFTNEIKSFIYRVGEKTDADVVITEIGGTVGDIESQPFLDAIRQFQVDIGRNNSVIIHVTLIPYLKASG